MKCTPACNSRFAKAGGSCFYDSEVLNSSSVHLMKFSAKIPRLRKAANRCRQWQGNTVRNDKTSKYWIYEQWQDLLSRKSRTKKCKNEKI